jgi:CheY-like chemotaxis protein
MEPVRVLFVDDEPGIRLTIPEILHQHGFSVTAVGTVNEALAVITSAQFDVLISDLNIGQAGDGFTVVSAMRRTQPNCVTLILTGYPDFGTALEAIRNQVDGYLIKPAQIPTLVSLIEQKLKNREPGAGVATKRIVQILRENTFEITQRALTEMKLLHDFGYGVCILTKAPMNAVKDIPLFNPKIDCLGCTITTFDPAEIEEWEPNAPYPQYRLAALKEFHDAGIYTWVSMEPIISPATSLDVVKLTHRHVDHYKTGLMNVRGVPLPDGYSNHDWKAYAADFIAMCESYGRSWFAKHTLESYLPVGAVNEKFRPIYHG